MPRYWKWLGLFFLGIGLSSGCQTGGEAVVVERTVVIEAPVTRLVEAPVTRWATVQVPVEITREVFIPATVESQALGSAENPIRLVFAPFALPATAAARAQTLADDLATRTGLSFLPVIAETHADAIEQACAAPGATMAFLPAISFVLAHNQCDLQAWHSGVHFGVPWSGSMIVVRGGRDIRDVEDLAGKSWGVDSLTDVVNYLFFKAKFQSLGIEPGATTTFDTDASTVIALFDDQVEFATADFKPPILPYDEHPWVYGADSPEIWRRADSAPYRSGIGFVVVKDYVERGGYQVRDARAAVLDSRPLIFASTTILALSDPIPNEALAFGAEMPLALTRQLGSVMQAYTGSGTCSASVCSADFLAWEGVAPVDDAAYEPLRFIQTQLELSDADMLGYVRP